MPLTKDAFRTGTSGYQQSDVDAWWAANASGPAPIVPQSLIGWNHGGGRDAISMYNYGTGKKDKKSRRGRTKEEADFLNFFNKVAVDPYRRQSGLSRAAGGVLSVAGTISGAGPVWTAMNAAANYGNGALANPTTASGVKFQDPKAGTLGASGTNTGMAAIGDIPSYSPLGTPSGAGLSGSTSMADSKKKAPKGGQYQYRDSWFSDMGQAALGRAGELADRPYTPYEGERVAGLSDNEQQASGIASGMGESYAPMRQRLQGGFSQDNLGQFMNPYTDAVLGARTRAIGDEFTRQSSALDRNKAATDAFRSGRTDLQRARLGASRMRALDEATNEVKAAAFESGKDSMFRQGSQDIGAIGAFSSADSNQISALGQTGGADRSVRQAQADFDYGQHLERRDWSMNNLNALLTAIGAVNPAAGTYTLGGKKEGGSSGTDWSAIIGLAGSIAGEYYGGGG
jgi:hypothetical protein